jgi:hypothetical protein
MHPEEALNTAADSARVGRKPLDLQFYQENNSFAVR